ncbi:unnamed protein product [Macrosiphum euphorbiae]|uniref:Uncharacterized protein n=1 Tax=Macrosiphum euphorbiae TaxID=13131 RepID=A0AAV0VLX6_9HEMI|nr:unnamed protein product [Macrosiphum euphorbiae]
MDNERTYQVPSLLKTAYYACNQIDRDRFDSLDVPDVDLRSCCESLFELLKIEKTRNEGNDRHTMYSRALLASSDDERFRNICKEAASHGHINCLKLAHEIGVPWDDNDRAYDLSVRPADLESLKYASGQLCLYDERTCSNAAENGHMDCLVYARENGCPWDQSTCYKAALGGHLDCLVFARENGCPWDVRTCSNAAINGHMDCLIYARENGCPWDQSTCFSAVLGGHLDCLIFARENGCPWGEWTCSRATEYGYTHCLVYAREEICPWDESKCYNVSASGGHLDCFVYARENGCPWDKWTCSQAADGGHMDCLVTKREQWSIMEFQAYNDDFLVDPLPGNAWPNRRMPRQKTGGCGCMRRRRRNSIKPPQKFV